MTIHIKNGTLIDPLGLRESKSDVYIEGNLVVGVGHKPSGIQSQPNNRREWPLDNAGTGRQPGTAARTGTYS